MSTLKVSAIQNPAAGSGGLVLAADGNVSGAGMDLIVSQSFSAVASVSVDDCFTSEYDNYKIALRLTAVTGTTTTVSARLRAAGVDASTASTYITMETRNLNGTPSAAKTTSDKWQLMNVHSTVGDAGLLELNLYDPAKAIRTLGSGMQAVYANAVPDIYAMFYGLFHNPVTAYDGLTLYPASGTITGTLRVYGYRN